MNPFRVILNAVTTLYEELFHLLLMGALTTLILLLPSTLALWLLLQSPAPLLLALLGIPLLLCTPGAFALGGIWATAYAAVKGQGVTWPGYWEGIRQHGFRTFKSLALLAAGYLLVITNIWFYLTTLSPFSPEVSRWVILAWGGVALIWSGAGFYLLAFQLEMEEPKVFLALRNSLFMALLHPLNTLIWLLFLLLVSALVIVLPPMVFLLFPAQAILSLTGLNAQLEPLRKKRAQESEASGEK